MEKFVKKGTKIAVECEAKQDEYKDRNGNDVRTISFTVKSFEFMESKGPVKADAGANNTDHAAPATEGFYPTVDIDDADLPF